MTADEFGSRFSIEEWFDLLLAPGFEDALDRRDWKRAEAIAHEALGPRQTDLEVAAAYQTEQAQLHREVRSFVGQWARALGRTGPAHKQARQCRIRSLMKHGLASPYAHKLHAEIRQAQTA